MMAAAWFPYIGLAQLMVIYKVYRGQEIMGYDIVYSTVVILLSVILPMTFSGFMHVAWPGTPLVTLPTLTVDREGHVHDVWISKKSNLEILGMNDEKMIGMIRVTRRTDQLCRSKRWPRYPYNSTLFNTFFSLAWTRPSPADARISMWRTFIVMSVPKALWTCQLWFNLTWSLLSIRWRRRSFEHIYNMTSSIPYGRTSLSREPSHGATHSHLRSHSSKLEASQRADSHQPLSWNTCHLTCEPFICSSPWDKHLDHSMIRLFLATLKTHHQNTRNTIAKTMIVLIHLISYFSFFSQLTSTFQPRKLNSRLHMLNKFKLSSLLRIRQNLKVVMLMLKRESRSMLIWQSIRSLRFW